MSEFEEFAGPASEGQETQRHIVALTRAIGRIEGKLDGFLDKMGLQDKRLSDLDERVRGVEGHQYKATGAAGVLGLLAGGLVSLATHFLKS